MFLLLLSLIIVVVQGFLGMADWWVLGSNWLLAGAISMGLTFVLSNQRLAVNNVLAAGVKAWVLLSCVMNLTAIHLVPAFGLLYQDVLLVGFTALIVIGLLCWQDKQIPLRSLGMGMVIGVMTLCYSPTLLWLLFPLLIYYHCSSWSFHNLCCLLSGLLTLVWIAYCFLFLGISEDAANSYIFHFFADWRGMHFSLPDLVSTVPDLSVGTAGYTAPVFLLGSILCLLCFIFFGLLSSSFNSLRMRSNVMLYSVAGLLLLIGMSTCWPLFIVLTAIIISLHLLLALGNEPSRMVRLIVNFSLGSYLFLSLGEYLIRLSVAYLSTLTFSLPFSLPFWD